MRGRTGLFLLTIGALLGLSASGLAQPVAGGGLGEAAVEVLVEPSAQTVQEAGFFTLDVQVIGGLYCAPGMSPAPLVGTLLPERTHDRLDLTFQPEQIRLEWEPTGGAGEVEYRVNETVPVSVGVLSAPVERVVTQFHVLFAPEGGRDDPGCTAQGYQVSQSERDGRSVTVEPDPEATQEDGVSRAPIDWVPLVLALALLGVVSLFAYQREQRRREK